MSVNVTVCLCVCVYEIVCLVACVCPWCVHVCVWVGVVRGSVYACVMV